MSTPKRYLITAALPYANGQKHIGHLAGAYLPADIYVRYLKAQKRDAVFVCGSDEHGTAIPIQATKEGTTAQTLKLDGTETYDVVGLTADIKPQQDLTLKITRKSGAVENVPVRCRIDTPIEIDYYQHGGILPFVLRQLLAA